MRKGTTDIDDIKERYARLNASFDRTMVWHLGIDAGFFAEYTYMLNAMLYCLKHRIEFRLYSADANFACGGGWRDFFEPFCQEDNNALHQRYNYHRIPTLSSIFRRARNEQGKLTLGHATKLMTWKAKRTVWDIIGRIKARMAYGKWVLLNSDARFDELDCHWSIPQLGIEGDYLTAFSRMVEITWHFNAELTQAGRNLAAGLQLPQRYAACQVRGGDKITEVALVGPEKYVETLREVCPEVKDVFILTDDYRLYEQLSWAHPDYRFYTLCSRQETGYVNKQFTATAAEAKKQQMHRFLTSMELMRCATTFIGSITTGPSMFLLKVLHPAGIPIDAKAEDIPRAALMRIDERGIMAKQFVEAKEAQKS